MDNLIVTLSRFFADGIHLLLNMTTQWTLCFEAIIIIMSVYLHFFSL